jgi:hypothetical protein
MFYSRFLSDKENEINSLALRPAKPNPFMKIFTIKDLTEFLNQWSAERPSC